MKIFITDGSIIKKKTNHKIINSYIENFIKSEDYALSLKHQNLNNEN